MSNTQTHTYYCTQIRQLLETSKFDKVSEDVKRELQRLGPAYINPEYSKHYRQMSIQQIEAATMYYTEMFDFANKSIEDIDKRYCSIEDAFYLDDDYFMTGNVTEHAEEAIEFRKYLIENPQYNVELNSGMLNWLLDCIEAEY